MGNLLRGDDGFGIRVLQALNVAGDLPDDVDLYEAGIGGISFVQEMMKGYDGLIVIDAIEKKAAPGALFVVEPDLDQRLVDDLQLHEKMVDMHYADPSKVLLLAKALNVYPDRVYVVACQPERVDEAVEGLSPAVERAIGPAADEVIRLIGEMRNSS